VGTSVLQDQQNSANFLTYLFSIAFILQLGFKLLFNFKHKGQTALLDKWTLLDTISAVLNIIAAFIIENVSSLKFPDRCEDLVATS